jgi:FKBP-type peptidyl-prolyl cis-trans isomerase
MNRLYCFSGICVFALLLNACRAPVQEMEQKEISSAPEQFVKANQYMYQRHQDHISAFVERAGWKAETTPSGLWVVIEEEGNGPRIEDNNIVTFAFESTLLDGTPCYDASMQNPKVITVGKGGVVSGVEQGMRKLSKGSKAIFLIPPHLAHGNFGDRENIPGNTVLIYRIIVVDVK